MKLCIDCKHHKIIDGTHQCKQYTHISNVTGEVTVITRECNEKRTYYKSDQVSSIYGPVCGPSGTLWEPKESRKLEPSTLERIKTWFRK